MPHRETKFTVNLVLVIISERGGAHRAGFVRIPFSVPETESHRQRYLYLGRMPFR